MSAIFQFLQNNPYFLLFLVVGLAVGIGRLNFKGYGLGMVAGAIVVGAGLSVWASTYGAKLELNNFAKSLFYYLFMYGVGLRVGPSFINSLKGDGLKFSILAVVSCVLGLSIVVLGVKLFNLPPGAAGGILAGSQTMSAAIGSAEQATSVIRLPAGVTPQDAASMVALSYGITYIWGTVGIILICKYLPRWWGVDAKAAAKQYEAEFGVANVDDSGLSGFRPFGLRAYRLENAATAGQTIESFRKTHPEYRIANVVRGDEALGADPSLTLQRGDVVALGGRIEALTDKMGLIGPEVADQRALNIPLDQAEIIVTNKDVVGQGAGVVPRRAVRRTAAGREVRTRRRAVPGWPQDSIAAHGHHLGGRPQGRGSGACRQVRPHRPPEHGDRSPHALRRHDPRLPDRHDRLPGVRIAGRPWQCRRPAALWRHRVVAGFAPSLLRQHSERGAQHPGRPGLVVFVAIVGVNAGNSLLAQLTGAIALKIFLVGFVACSIPPFIVWAIGYHYFKINPAVLMGGVAGARSHSGPCREAAAEIGSSVPWIGFPVAYALSGIMLTVFGYFAMILAQ